LCTMLHVVFSLEICYGRLCFTLTVVDLLIRDCLKY